MTRVGASESGQRTSFNRAEGISDIEGKVARVATSKLGNERVSISLCHRQARRARQPARADALAYKTDGPDSRSKPAALRAGVSRAANITAGRGHAWEGEGARAPRSGISASRGRRAIAKPLKLT